MHTAQFTLLSFIFICSSLITAHANQADKYKNTSALDISSNVKTSSNIAIAVSSRHTLQLSVKPHIAPPKLILTNIPKQEPKPLPQGHINNTPSNFYTSMLIFNDKLQQSLSFLKSIELKMLIDVFKTPIVL